MPHCDPEVLALHALGGDLPASDEAHLAGCALCTGELGRLAQVVTVARAGDAGPAGQGGQAGQPELLEAPPPGLWASIAAAAGVDPAVDPQPGPAVNGHHPASALTAVPPAAGPGAAGPASDPAPSESRSGRRARVPRWRRHPVAVAIAAAAAGLIIGAGAVAGIGQLKPSAGPPAGTTIALRPLPQFPQWRGTSGTAVMHRSAAATRLDVTLRAPDRPGFYEVWLLARNGVSMIALGDLSAAHTGRFAVPPGVSLRNYSRIDVSLQQFNGNPLHSRTSVVRGSLPG